MNKKSGSVYVCFVTSIFFALAWALILLSFADTEIWPTSVEPVPHSVVARVQ